LASQGGAAIDLVELERLCALHCPYQEIASYFGVTAERIEQERQSPLVAPRKLWSVLKLADAV